MTVSWNAATHLMEAKITYQKNGGTVTTAAFENKVATTGLTGTKVWLDGGRENAERGNVELTLYQYVLAYGKDAAVEMKNTNRSGPSLATATSGHGRIQTCRVLTRNARNWPITLWKSR